jgi:hypothetical protein
MKIQQSEENDAILAVSNDASTNTWCLWRHRNTVPETYRVVRLQGDSLDEHDATEHATFPEALRIFANRIERMT